MLPDRVSNPGPLTYESDALLFICTKLYETTFKSYKVDTILKKNSDKKYNTSYGSFSLHFILSCFILV